MKNKISDKLLDILKNKKEELCIRKEKAPLSEIKLNLKKSDRSFLDSINNNNNISLIAEIKKSSPNMSIDKKVNVVDIAKIYEENNVNAISVLCDEKFFDGSLDDLRKVRENTSKAVLAKDFIIDEYQIFEARKYGADAVLLIVKILGKNDISKFSKIAFSLNMDVIFEVNNKDDLENIYDLKKKIIMINNRNLNNFKVDLDNTNNLINKISKDKVIISASGINSCFDIKKLSNRINAVLVGTSIMKSDNPAKKIKELLCKK